MLLPMMPLTVLYCIQQMCWYLDNIRDVAEWVTAVEEIVVCQVEAFSATPDPVICEGNGDNFDYKENLD